MCCILVCAKGSRPKLENLFKIEKRNGDGAGIAWFNKDGKAQFVKGLDAQEIFDMTKYMKESYCIHFRSQSVGRVDKLLTHPFLLSEKSPLSLRGSGNRLLFHNGTVRNWDELLAAADIEEPKELMSDSRAIAMILSKAKNPSRLLKKIPGKFVVVDSEIGKFKMFGDFTEEDGIFYSNTFWKWETQTNYHGYGQQTRYNSDDYSEFYQPALPEQDKGKETKQEIVEAEEVKKSDSLTIAEVLNQNLLSSMTRNERKRFLRKAALRKFWCRHWPVLGVSINTMFKVKEVKDMELKELNDAMNANTVNTVDLEQEKAEGEGLRIHETPPKPFFSPNTNNILGYPSKGKIHPSPYHRSAFD